MAEGIADCKCSRLDSQSGMFYLITDLTWKTPVGNVDKGRLCSCSQFLMGLVLFSCNSYSVPKPPNKAKQLPELCRHAQVAVCDWSLVSAQAALKL